MARWWLHETMTGYRLELDAERRAERKMYQLQEACAGHGDSGTAAFERMMKPRVEEFVREMRAAAKPQPRPGGAYDLTRHALAREFGAR